MDLDKLGPELERMGDEIERQMEGLDGELSQLGDRIGKNFAKKFGKDFARNFGPGGPGAGPGNSHDSDDADDEEEDDDDRPAAAVPAPPEAADPDLGPAIAALKGLALDAGQRAQLAQLRGDSDRQITAARVELERMSSRLHDTLRDAEAKDVDVAQQIEAISAKEAAIRKARILTWLKVRRMLHPDQRKVVEEAIQNR
jgi:Spy/CpxP family protein refolding chaperone